jgi:hypothetical protein
VPTTTTTKPPVTTTTAKPKKKTTIRCVSRKNKKRFKDVTAVNPKCPSGFKRVLTPTKKVL